MLKRKSCLFINSNDNIVNGTHILIMRVTLLTEFIHFQKFKFQNFN